MKQNTHFKWSLADLADLFNIITLFRYMIKYATQAMRNQLGEAQRFGDAKYLDCGGSEYSRIKDQRLRNPDMT